MAVSPIGRPSKYDPAFCDQLVEHMSQGYSFESFGAEIGTCKKTLYNWVKEHDAFLHAYEKGQLAARAWWERQGHKGMWEEKDAPKLNTALWIFMMKARFKMFDRPSEPAKEPAQEQDSDTSDLESQLLDIVDKT